MNNIVDRNEMRTFSKILQEYLNHMSELPQEYGKISEIESRTEKHQILYMNVYFKLEFYSTIYGPVEKTIFLAALSELKDIHKYGDEIPIEFSDSDYMKCLSVIALIAEYVAAAVSGDVDLITDALNSIERRKPRKVREERNSR